MTACVVNVEQLSIGLGILVVFTFGVYVGVFIMRLRKG